MEVIVVAKLQNNNNVILSVHIPYIYNSTNNTSGTSYTKIRSGYFQNGSNGGYADFAINDSGNYIQLHNAYLNGNDVSSSTVWEVYYRYKI